MTLNLFTPINRLLMGPGPSNVHPRVLKAISQPTIGHLDPQFIGLMDNIKSLLRYAFQTENEVTFAVSGPGSVGMETCLVNLIEPGDKVIVCINGVFGGRMKDIVERCGATPIDVTAPWGSAIDPGELEDKLKQNKDVHLVAFVHAETSTGAKSDIKTLAEIAHKFDCITVADTVTSLGGIPLQIDEWRIDCTYSGTQKCLSCPPGLSPVSFNQRAVDRIINRNSKVQSWFMDINLILDYWGNGAKRTYHHTAPINSLYGLHEALLILKEEGLEQSWERHKLNGQKLITELGSIGLLPYVKANERLPELTSIAVPSEVDESKVRKQLLEEYNIEIGAGLGELAGKIWRIGLMGYTSTEKNVNTFVNAINDILENK
ncbi:MAG: alanine--glyoxylate aminotransferase family protein [Ignavibacteriaceae bacterium]|jgi:alanine-glyoxylate transaminase/serine-glyoxylate transaminase/serine-pyruvate transaminase